MIETGLQIRPLPLTTLMWNNRENNSASSRKRRLSDGNEAAAQATISGGTTPIGFKRWRRSGHDAPDQQAGSNDIGSTSSEAIEGRTSAHPTGDENSLALINDPLQVTTNQRRNVLQATCAIAIDALKIVKDVAEAVPVAGNPLKATCGVIIDMLELIRVRRFYNNIAKYLRSSRNQMLSTKDGRNSFK